MSPEIGESLSDRRRPAFVTVGHANEEGENRVSVLIKRKREGISPLRPGKMALVFCD